MPIVTISDLTPEQIVQLEFRQRRGNNRVDLEDSTKYAVVLLKLAGAVTPGDYPTLKTNIEAVTGVQEVTLLIDHETRASVLADHTQVLRVMGEVSLRHDPPPE